MKYSTGPSDPGSPFFSRRVFLRSTMAAAAGLSACSRRAPENVTLQAGIAYAEIPGVEPALLSLDIYTPAPKPEGAPSVVWVHGGGVAIGDKENQMNYKPGLFTGAGYVFVAVNYRLSPFPASNDPGRVMHPDHVSDVVAALAWVSSNIAAHGGDGARILLLGHSAGAHLVALAATDGSYLGAHGLGLGILRGVASVDTEGYDIPALMARNPLDMYINAFGNNPETWRDASPASHVASGAGIPPFLLVSRGTERRRKQCRAFADALSAAAVPVTVVDAAGLSHDEVNRRIGMPGDQVITPALMEFYENCLNR